MNKYFENNRLQIPEKLLFYLHSQLKIKSLEFTHNRYDSLDSISDYLISYFKEEFKVNHSILFHLFNSKGIGLKSANIGRALKGKKGKQIVNKNIEVSYILLDLMCYASWNKSMLEALLDTESNWEDNTVYSVEIPEYVQKDIDNLKIHTPMNDPIIETDQASKINIENKKSEPLSTLQKIKKWFPKNTFLKYLYIIISLLIVGSIVFFVNICSNNNTKKYENNVNGDNNHTDQTIIEKNYGTSVMLSMN